MIQAILLNTGKPMPTSQLGVLCISLVVILFVLKEVKKKADSTDTGAGKNETWATLYKLVRMVYWLALVYLLYIMIDWLFL